MYRLIKVSLLFFALVVCFTHCRKKELDEYYGRPDNLDAPIYQQLLARKNFSQLLSLIDKAGYKNILSTAGYWTFFAPNDSAFQKFYADRGIGGVSAVDSTTAQSIVQYLLVYNGFTKDRLDDFQANIGWVENEAFRRRTAYYAGFYKDTMANGQVVTSIASNRNGNGLPYVPVDNNNKYIPYFTDVYFAGKKLSAADYNYFYPGSQYTGFNVADAKVLNANINAENGTIHEIDRVIAPLPSIEEYLKSRPEYSEFRKLYNKYMVSFQQNADASRRYQVLSGKTDPVYVKVYNSLLAFSPNNENFMKIQDNDAQQNGWSIFVPKNDVLLSYANNVILEYYKTFDAAPPQVIADFLNAHMWQSAVWPSKFNSTANFLGEEARFNPQADIFDRKILSNAVFYGTNKVQEANVFSSVYAKAYLDPKFSLMTRLLDVELKFSIISPNQQYTLFMMPDVVIKAAGYDYNPSINEWGYTPPGGTRTAGEAVRQRLLRILQTSVIETPRGELNSLAGSGIAESFNSEYITFSNNLVRSGGTQEKGIALRVDSSKTARNGKVYYLNGLLTFADSAIGIHIKNLGQSATSEFNYYWKLLESSSIYNGIAGSASYGEITGTSAGTFYTIFIPSNDAIRQAVKDGMLPGDKATGLPTLAPTVAADREQISRFIQYHILNKKTVIPNGKESGGFESLLKSAKGDVLPITVISQPGGMQLTDMNGRKANVIVNRSNNLSNRTVIHLIDNYLQYNY